MCFWGVFVLLSLAVLSISRPLYAAPDQFPHIAEFDVTNVFLFNLIKEHGGTVTHTSSMTVLQTILRRHHVPLEKCDLSSIDFFTSKLKRLFTAWGGAKGSSMRSKLLKRW